jgi:uncharacterized protein (UPF0335 family)
MGDREKLINDVGRWIKIDEDMKEYRKEMKNLRKEKKEITNNLVNVMKENQIDCFDVKNGKLIYTKSKTKKPLSKTHLLESLKKFFINDPNMSNIVVDISKFIMNSREEKINESIKMKIKK